MGTAGKTSVTGYCLQPPSAAHYYQARITKNYTIKHYRVDKMRDTEIMEADRKGEESFKNFDLAAFAKKTFGMYGGVDAEVTLECRNELAGVVIDRFGHDVWMCPHGEDHFRARVPVAVSSQFFGWITGIGSGMRIVGPEDVRQQYKEYLQSVIQNYMD